MTRVRRRRTGVLAGVLSTVLAGTLLGAAPVAAAPSGVGPASPTIPAGTVTAGSLPTAAVTSIVLTGRGYGHGRGMSQYGAKGQAEAGRSAAQIVSFYYPGTSLVTDGDNKTITVWLRSGTVNNETWVVAEEGMSLTTPNAGPIALPSHVAGATAPVTAWRLRLVSRTFQLDGYVGGRWYRHEPADITAALSNVTSATFSDSDGTVRVIGSNYVEHRGTVTANRTTSPPAGADANVETTVTVTMKDYLQSVVPSEMPASWSAAAVQAQSIAARTYASYDRDVASRPWWYDTCDTTACQVYNGVGVSTDPWGPVTSYEDSRATAAIAATSGRILTHGGKPAFTQFSASNGGYTLAGAQPYLVSKADPYDAYPEWTATLTPAAIQQRYPQIGVFTRLSVTRDGRGSYGGRVTSVTLTGIGGSVTVTGDQFRSAFGLRSTMWDSRSVTPPPRPPLPPLTPLITPQRDWNLDTRYDLIARGPDGRLFVYAGKGKATWSAKRQIGRGWQVMGFMTQVYNFNGTGKPEIVTTDPSTGALMLYAGDGRGGFDRPRRIGQGWHGFTSVIGVQDWHRPGQAALMAQDDRGRLFLYPSNGTGGFAAKRLIGVGWGSMDLIEFAGDFSGDGRTDLIAREAATGTLWLYPGNGSGGFLARRQIGTGWGMMDMILSGADWDRDGRIDVVARDPSTGDLWLYPGNGRGGFQDRRQVGYGWLGFDLVS